MEGYRPDADDFLSIRCKRGESHLTQRNKGRTGRERAKNARRIQRRLARASK